MNGFPHRRSHKFDFIGSLTAPYRKQSLTEKLEIFQTKKYQELQIALGAIFAIFWIDTFATFVNFDIVVNFVTPDNFETVNNFEI